MLNKIKKQISKSRLKRKEKLGYLNSPETRKKMSISQKMAWENGKYTKERNEKISQTKKGKKPYKMTNEIRKKIGEAGKGRTGYWIGKKRPLFSEKTRKKMSESHKGEKHWNWKDGITPENNKIRASRECLLWRKSVFVRDNFTCQKYSINGGELIAHHINNFSQFPELRFAIDNGITDRKSVV